MGHLSWSVWAKGSNNQALKRFIETTPTFSNCLVSEFPSVLKLGGILCQRLGSVWPTSAMCLWSSTAASTSASTVLPADDLGMNVGKSFAVWLEESEKCSRRKSTIVRMIEEKHVDCNSLDYCKLFCRTPLFFLLQPGAANFGALRKNCA